MKKIILSISILLSGIAFSQNFKSTDKIGHTKYFTKMDSNWNIIKVKDADKISDSLKFEFLQTVTINKLNKI